MEELQKLYDVLVREGKYTKSFEEFQSKWSQDEAYKNKVYDVVNRDGLYTKDKESFFQKYSTKAPIQSTTQETQVPLKKKSALDSSSEAGSLVSKESVKPQQQAAPQVDGEPPVKPMQKLTKEGFAKAMAEAPKTDAERFAKEFEQRPDVKTLKDFLKSKEIEKKKYEDIYDKQLSIKPKVEDSQYLKDRLSTINTELINKEEEYVVPELQYQFGDLGFKFEESGATGDYVKVTAPNGKTTEISLDNFLTSKSKAESEILQKFIKENTPAKGLFVLEKTMKEEDIKFNSEKQVENSIKSISNELSLLNNKQKDFLLKRTELEKQYEELSRTPQNQRASQEFIDKVSELDKQKILLDSEMKSILQEEERLNQKGKKLDSAVGKYTIAKSKQGDWIGGIRNAILGGIGKISSGFTSLTVDVTSELMPLSGLMPPKMLAEKSFEGAEKLGISVPTDKSEKSFNEFKKTLTESQLSEIESYVRDQAKKSAKEDLLPAMRIGAEELFGDIETTKQWKNLKKEGFWGGAILGLAESLPAMIGGAGPAGWAQRTALMYAQVSDGLSEEMENDPDFKDITENEKLAITLPIGITSAVLENYGLRNIMASKGVINSIAMSVLGKTGKGVTAKSFRELVENEVESKLAKGTLIITAAGAAEFETGAAQELTETSFKMVYDKIKEKDMFNTPDSIKDLMENVVVSGAQEAVGGFVLGVPSGVSTAYAKKGFLKMDDVTFETFANMANDEKMQSAYIASLKEKITSGILTQKEAKEQLNNYRSSVGLFRQLPDGLNTQQKKEAMNLLKEKRDLETYIDGKDPALVVKQKNRITEINDSLTKISEQPTAEYIIDNNKYTKEEFFNQLQGKTQDELKAMNIVVNNDEQTATEIGKLFNIKTEQDAIQKQAAGQVPVQPTTRVGETMEEGKPQAEPEVTTEEGVKEEVTQTIIEPKVVITGTRNGMENLESSNYDQKTDTKIKDARGREQEFGKNNVLVEDDGKGNKVINIKADAIDSFGRAGFLQASVIVPADTDVDVDAVKQVVDSEVNRIKEKNNETLRLNEVDPRDLSLMRDAIVNAVKPAPTTEAAPTAPVSDTRADIKRRRQEELKSEKSFEGNRTQADLLSLPDNYLKKGEYVQINNVNISQDSTMPDYRTGRYKVQMISIDVNGKDGIVTLSDGNEVITPKISDLINAKYDAELAALEGAKPTTVAAPTVPTTEATPTEVDKIKSDIEASKDRLKKAWDKYKTMGIAFDPKNQLAKDKELVKSLINYAFHNIKLGSYNAAKLIEDLASEGFEITRNGAKFIMDKASKKVQRETNKTLGIKPKPTEQERINKAFSIGVATQKIATEEAKAEVKDLKAQISDLFKAGIEALKIARNTAKNKERAQKEITQNLSKEIKELASTGKITAKQAANIVRAFSKVDVFNQDSIDKFTDYMARVFEKAEQTQQEEQKKDLLSKMLKLVSKKAKTSITQTGKRRSAGLDAQGQSFFVAVKEVLRAFSKNDQTLIDKLNEQLSDEIAIDEAINKELRGEELTTKENMLLNRALAFDMFSDITNKSYEEIKSLYDGLVEARSLSIKNLKQKRLDRAAQADTLKNQADNQIKKDFGILFNEDGSVKGTNQLRQEEEKIYQNFRELKIWSAIKEFVKRIDFTTITGIKDYFRSRLAHIGTLTNILDKSGTFFTDNVYRLLNQMEEKYLKGYYNQMNKLDEIASSIDGIKSYKDITKKLYTGVKKITINGKENFFNADQLLRIYVLSKNNIQNNKLNAMGIDKNVLDKIEQMLDPSVIEFADKIVDYLSNEYFESVNAVYSNLNDVNLGFVENYFPTKTIQKKTESRLLEDGDFNGIFNAETAPALKERTDVGGEIDLSPAFTDVLDNHFQTIEKYKAYAEGVRKLNQLFNIESVNTLIEEIGIKPLLKRSINFAINPTAGLKEKQSFISKAMNKFTSFALSFKVWQLPKQATSFINAYEDYQFLKNKKTPGLDLLMFMVDSAYVIATLPKQIKTAYDMSASFKERLNKGIVGDSYVMESGTRLFRPVDKSYSIIARLRRGFKLAGAAFTIIGDIIGVMGYMVNHRRNMINKMDSELALEKFNDYNATAQTRRGSEKIALQQSQNDLTRAFTMFGSTTFLMMNKVAIAQTNIMRSLKKGEVPNQKDIRSLVLMLGLSNAMFVLVSNIGKFIYGDDDDKEEVKKSMFEALIGLDLLFSVPIIGAGLETAYRKAMGEKTRTSQGVNPYIQVFRKVEKAMESSDIVNSVRPFIELVLGAQIDPAIGLYNYFKSDDDPEAIYDILGISESYRPKTESEIIASQKRKKEKEQVDGEMEERVEFIQKMIDEAYSPQQVESAEAMLDRVKNPKMYKEEKEELKAMKERLLVDEETGTVYENLTDLKRYNPELYEKNFGEGSEYYELSKPQKELDKLLREEERAAKDEEFGYVPKNKKRKNSDGTFKKYSSMLKSYSGKGYKSKSNSKYEYYDSRGIKTTVTRSRERN